MNADHTLVRITAHLLSTLPYLALIQGVLLAWCLWQGGGAAWGQFGLSLLAVYLHIRLAFDQRVFQDFAAQHYTPYEFDICRAQLGLGKTHVSRDIQARCRGALRLWRMLLALVVCQYLWTAGQLAF